MIEERSALVRLTLKVTTRIVFSPIERDGPITKSDFIEAAHDSLPRDFFTKLAGEGFDISYPIDGEVFRALDVFCADVEADPDERAT